VKKRLILVRARELALLNLVSQEFVSARKPEKDEAAERTICIVEFKEISTRMIVHCLLVELLAE
jgi:hypothetical protein